MFIYQTVHEKEIFTAQRYKSPFHEAFGISKDHLSKGDLLIDRTGQDVQHQWNLGVHALEFDLS